MTFNQSGGLILSRVARDLSSCVPPRNARITTRTYDHSLPTSRITEAELARDVGSILDRVASGVEIIIERDARPVAILRPAFPRRRRLSEIAASLPGQSTATLDPDFAADVQDFIDRHREPARPPNWDE